MTLHKLWDVVLNLVAREKLFVNFGMHCVVFGCDWLNDKAIRAEAVLRLFNGIELAVGGCEAGVATKVCEADTFNARIATKVCEADTLSARVATKAGEAYALRACLAGEVIFRGEGRVQQGVQGRVLKVRA